MLPKVRNISIFFKKIIKQDSFIRDILFLVVVSIVIGALLANSVSFAANTYFSKTVASLVGDYGEYDLVIQSREQTKDDAALQIQKILNEAFPGAKFKEGPTITGKTNFFIALPEQYKTKAIYESLGKTFGSIPGGAGVGVMTEPRITIRGVPDGAKNMLIERIGQMDGVRFAFRDGASVGVVLSSVNKAGQVTDKIKALLGQYQVLEIAFPVGSEPANPIKMGEAIAQDIETNLHVEYAKNVSIDGKNDDMTYMVSTMMELKRFLMAYASQIVITPTAPGVLLNGDTVIFQGTAANPPVSGNAPEKGNVIVQITGVRADGTLEGLIQQGDALQLINLQGYKLEKSVVGTYVGNISYRNPRQELGTALSETSKLVSQIPAFAADTKNMSSIAVSALDNYGGSISAVESTLNSLQSAGSAIQAATSGLANIDTSALRAQLNTSSSSMNGLINTLQVLKLVNGEGGGTINALTAAQHNLANLSGSLLALDNVAEDARRAQNSINNIVDNGQNTIAKLKAFDVDGARNNLLNINTRLSQVEQVNIPLITAQLQYMSASVPNLKDEEISHSVALLDKFIAGQVIPGERIQILTAATVPTDAVQPIIQHQVGHNNISLYSTALGIIEPNPRTELFGVLNEVRSVLAGMTGMIVTILFLVLDHTAVMSVIRRKRLINKVAVKGWRNIVYRLTITFTAPERQYGMVIGAVLLTLMFVLSGGGIPYLPWIGVPILGAIMGLIVAGYAEKISPISREEVLAGEALGLSFDEIMREIVIPCSRPGLLQKLNRRKLNFK